MNDFGLKPTDLTLSSRAKEQCMLINISIPSKNNTFTLKLIKVKFNPTALGFPVLLHLPFKILAFATPPPPLPP